MINKNTKSLSECVTVPLITTYYCNSCGELYNYTKTNRTTKSLCRKCISFRKRFDNKRKALEYKGNKCIKCGYSKCQSALHFHHFLGYTEGFFSEEEHIQYKKSFGIAARPEISWNKLKSELDKVVLLCSNCHLELHAGIFFLSKKEIGLN